MDTTKRSYHDWFTAIVSPDVVKIRDALGSHLEGVALFGSCARNGFEHARDIDLALFVEGLSLAQVRAYLQNCDLALPIMLGRIDDLYGGGGGYIPEKSYDFVVLSPGASRSEFVARNATELVYL